MKRFWDKVNIINDEDSCWEWIASTFHNGYGQFSLDGKNCRAHRLSYLWNVGPIKEDLYVLHSCDNPKCVRPSHLFLGTHQDNADDKTVKNRNPLGVSHGRARLTEEQVGYIRTSEESYKSLAKRFGMNSQYIINIRARKVWKHLK